MAKNAPKVRSSTQEHLDIEDIIDDLVLLKTGWVALVMTTTAVNFDLLSEAEQDATIYAYGAFLNSLSFPIETLIMSKKADITAYYQTLEEAERSQPNPDLKRQILKYLEFIQSTVQQKTVLEKKFYVIINFSPLELGAQGLAKKATAKKSKVSLIAAAKNALIPKRDHIISQTSRLGLITRQLTTQELIELFYDIYNPAPTGTQRVLLDTASYSTPIVEPSVAVPTETEPLAAVQNSLPSVQPQTPSPISRPAPQPSYPNPQQPIYPSDLRPVPPQPAAPTPRPVPAAPTPTATRLPVSPPASRPAPSPQPSQPSSPSLNQSQMEALKKLQEATQLAAQILEKSQPQPASTQPNSQNQGGKF